MNLSAGVLKLLEPSNARAQELSMATLQAHTTWHSHTKPLSRILTDQYLPSSNEEREGWAGQKIASDWPASKTLHKL